MNIFEKLCDRCKKRVAVVFVTRIEGNSKKNEGICLACARELKIQPVFDMLEKMGISDEDIDSMTDELGNLARNGEMFPPFNFGGFLDEDSDSNGDDSNYANGSIAEIIGDINDSTADFMNRIKDTGSLLPKDLIEGDKSDKFRQNRQNNQNNQSNQNKCCRNFLRVKTILGVTTMIKAVNF